MAGASTRAPRTVGAGARRERQGRSSIWEGSEDIIILVGRNRFRAA